VGAFAEDLRLGDRQAGLFLGLADGCLAGCFAGFDFAGWELSGEAAFFDAALDEEDAAVFDDDGGGDGGRLSGVGWVIRYLQGF
jgi:hypothetical protein